MIEEAGILRGEEFLTLEALDERVKRAAEALSSIGISAGDRVALLLRNDIAFFEAAHAAGMIGAIPVPQNWHGKPEEVLAILADCKATVLVAHADLARPVLDRLPTDLQVRVVPTPPDIAEAYKISPENAAVPEEMVEWGAWLESFEPRSEPPVQAPGAMMYTSGTTGQPKGVRREVGTSVTPYLADLARLSGFGLPVRAVVTGPMYHGAPLAWALGWVRSRSFVVLQDRFDAEDLLRLISEQRITNLMLVPIMFNRLLQLPEEVRAKYDVSSLQHVIMGAAPCPRHVKQAIIDWWGPVLVEQYGSLEIGVVTGATSEEWVAHPGTVGKALVGVSIKILDPDGKELPVGETGEIYTRVEGYGAFSYEGRPEAKSEIERDGFLTAGDIGYLDEDGFLYLSDRKKDMIISGGVNIYPLELEELLITMPGVSDVGVFGIPDEEYGEAVAAAVELDGTVPVTADDVRAFVRTHLAGYKVPKVVDFLDEIPRLDSGKILKRRLREPYWSATGRAI